MGIVKGTKDDPAGSYGCIGVGVLALAFQMLCARLAEQLVSNIDPERFDALLDGVIADLQRASGSNEVSADGAKVKTIKAVKVAFQDLSWTFRKKSVEKTYQQ